ncbi:hypothetical protein [Arenimonas sp. MALMAid1274]|uniref:hypothetical protein n=1 Tax=Arenimonas sp. MALMAid1274 TaxID=3411630 RepID=UPI003BA1BE95
MNPTPKWYLPVAVLALLWNLLGCAAFAMDLMLTPDVVATLPADQQALYAARPAWALVGTGLAVVGGALGSLGLVLKRAWAWPLLLLSLLGLLLQDAALVGLTGELLTPAIWVMQGAVLVIALGLVWLAWAARARGWLR